MCTKRITIKIKIRNEKKFPELISCSISQLIFLLKGCAFNSFPNGKTFGRHVTTLPRRMPPYFYSDLVIGHTRFWHEISLRWVNKKYINFYENEHSDRNFYIPTFFDSMYSFAPFHVNRACANGHIFRTSTWLKTKSFSLKNYGKIACSGDQQPNIHIPKYDRHHLRLFNSPTAFGL